MSEAIPGMMMVMLVTQLRYARISTRLLYPYLLCVGSSLADVAPPPTPTCDSSADEVNAWLAWFATNKLGASADELGSFRVAGDTLLSYTKDECWQISPRWGIALYNSLRRGTIIYRD